MTQRAWNKFVSTLQWVLLAAFFLALVWAPPAFSAVLTVCPGGCDYSDIDTALDHAAGGDEIRVAGGAYSDFGIRGHHAAPLTVSGAWDPTCTTQDPDQYQTLINGSISGSECDGQVVTLEYLTVTGSSAQGLYTYNTQPETRTLLDITIRNCEFYGNVSSGISLDDVGTAVVENCLVHDNGQIYGGIRVVAHGQVTITGNTVYNNLDSAGINVSYVTAGDVISGNLAYANKDGIAINGYGGDPTPVVWSNNVHDNTRHGFALYQTTPDMRHNLAHHNAQHGAVLSSMSGGGVISHNVFAHNGNTGLKFDNGDATPVINNNVIAYNWRGMELVSGMWGASDIRPVSLKNNCFYGTQAPHLAYAGASVPSYHSEEPGSYGCLNEITFPSEPDTGFSRGNFTESPGFTDAGNADYTLQLDSFLIDQAEPSDPFDQEPAPNGGRANVGAYGNTALAAASPAAPTVSNLSASVDGYLVTIGFDTNTATAKLRIVGEYYDTRDTAWYPFDAASGLTNGRVASGAGRQITWDASQNLPAGQAIAGCKVRVTASHGNASGPAESAGFDLDLTQPTIQHSPNPVEAWCTQGEDAYSAYFWVKNVGGGGPAYTLSESTPWLALDSAGGTLSTEGDQIRVDFSTAALAPGDHSGTVTVTADGAANSPYSVTVTVHVAGCTYSLGQNSQQVDAAEYWGNLNLNVLNSCPWEAVSDQPWLEITSGDSGAGTGTVSWRAAGNSGDQRSAVITVTGTGFSDTFTVTQGAPARSSLPWLGLITPQ